MRHVVTISASYGAGGAFVGPAVAERLGVPERTLDVWLWNRGQRPEYKARPRHRARTVFY